MTHACKAFSLNRRQGKFIFVIKIEELYAATKQSVYSYVALTRPPSLRKMTSQYSQLPTLLFGSL